MRWANVADRATLLVEGGGVDVAEASDGRLPADPQALLDRWDEFVDWTGGHVPQQPTPVDPQTLRAPVPRPRQVFAIGLNYRGHAEESGLTVPESPPTFTKFPTCITGPYAEVALPAPTVDWEVELVVVVGHRAEGVSEERAWSHVAGLTLGQDLSERRLQRLGPAPQYSLAKSFPGFGPTGPSVVTPDELPDPDDVEIGCSMDGEVLQKGRTSSLIFSVPALVARLSAVCPLLPGDLIFTGTPDGVGAARTPRRFLAPGQTLVSWADGIGELANPMRRPGHEGSQGWAT